jgi:hypothetical protein
VWVVGSEPAETTIRLTIVVPAFNEAPRLEGSAARLDAAVKEEAVDPATTELIVVDDGSDDDTSARAGEHFGHFPELLVLRLGRNRGKGAAIRAGVAASSGPIVVFMDADMSIDPAQVPLLERALEHADVAVGSRTRAGARAEAGTWSRALMGLAFNRVVNATTHVGLDDTQCGFKGFTAPAARLLFHLGTVDGYAFDVEVLALARMLGLDVAEVPVRWRHIPGSRIRPLTDALSMARDLQRAGSTRRRRPLVPALVVGKSPELAGAPLAAAARRVAGPTLPVVTTAEGVMVLFPLCGPERRRDAESGLRALAPGAEIRTVELAAPRLRGVGPLTDGAPERPRPGSLPWNGADA